MAEAQCFRVFSDLFEWPAVYPKRIQDVCPDAVANFATKLEQGIQMVTDYSGVGPPEVCMQFVVDALPKIAGGVAPEGCFQCERASDIDTCCRQILLCHEGPGAPACVFGQFSERCPAYLVKQSEELLQLHRQAWEDDQKQGRADKATKLRHGREFIDASMQVMLAG